MTYQPHEIRIHRNGKHYTAAWRDSAGNLRRRGLGSCLKKAKAKRDTMIGEHAIHPGARDMDTDIRLSHWLTRYAELRTPEIAPSTLSQSKQTCDLLFEYFKADPKLARITPSGMSSWRLWLACHHEMATGTVCKHSRTAKNIFTRAVLENLIVKSPADHLIGTPPPRDEPPVFVSEESMVDVVDADQRLTMLLALCYYAGLRVNEAIRLRWDDVDIEAGKIHVRSATGTRTTKQRSRTVRLENDLAGLMRFIHAIHDPSPGSTVAGIAEHGPVNYQRAFRDAVGKLPGGQTFTMKDLRATREMIWMKEYPPNVVCSWLGHSATVSIRHYNVVDDEYYEGGEA
jgi:integrase